ncbi:hypothetical protein M436DRAFT_63421 [Aureobasidium namibiae CBS 147.97]|uniref:C2H2-type domain-containing protein n=1 Tax=Aureobasidium namibiae CBS 147.97 TaxID=1043004 RepID=A0A074XHP7_9PEZI
MSRQLIKAVKVYLSKGKSLEERQELRSEERGIHVIERTLLPEADHPGGLPTRSVMQMLGRIGSHAVFAMPSHSESPFDYHDCPDSDCGQSFADLDTFHKHWTRHKGRCPFPFCETSVDSKYNFGRHCARRHTDYFVEHQRVEKTACKYRCGKSYSKADVSNLRRHEKTCRRKRDQRQPVDGDVPSATVAGNLYANTSEPLQNLHIQDSASPHRPASLEDRNTHEIIDPTQGLQNWRENRHTVEAIESLQRVLAGGPAFDALQAFTRFLDNVGPSVHRSMLADPSQENRAPVQSNDRAELEDVQQSCDRPRIEVVDVKSSHFSPNKFVLAKHYDSDFLFEPDFRYESDYESDHESIPEITLKNADSILRAAAEFWRCDVQTQHEKRDTDVPSMEEPEPKVITDFCRWFSNIFVCFKLTFNPKILALAVLALYHLNVPLLESKFGGGKYAVVLALMLFARFYETSPHTVRAWVEATGVPEAQMVVIEARVSEGLDNVLNKELDWVEDGRHLSHTMTRSLNLYARLRNPSPQWLLAQIKG